MSNFFKLTSSSDMFFTSYEFVLKVLKVMSLLSEKSIRDLIVCGSSLTFRQILSRSLSLPVDRSTILSDHIESYTLRAC